MKVHLLFEILSDNLGYQSLVSEVISFRLRFCSFASWLKALRDQM